MQVHFFFFFIKIILFSSNLILSSVKILQTLRSIEFTLRLLRLDDHKLGIFGIFQELLFLLSLFLRVLQLKNN